MTLYHYTTKANHDEIIRTGIFNSSNPWTSQDHTYGDGWYFTDLDPKQCKMAIALQCWQNEEALGKVQYYLKFEIDNSIVTSCRENVYIMKTWENNRIKHIEHGIIPNCKDYPCSNCLKGKNILQRFFAKIFNR
jgi:hypothetical protein